MLLGVHQTTHKLMENPFEDLKARSKAAGISLARACQLAGIPRSTIWYWKHHPPTQISAYLKMVEAIDKHATNADTPAVSA